MTYKTFRNLGQIGIIRDVPPEELPENAWSAGQNVAFDRDKVSKRKGHQQVFGTPVIAPWFLHQIKKNDNRYWFYAGENDIGSTDGNSHATVSETSAGYSSTLDLNWTAGELPGGVVVLNNGVDDPQVWRSSAFNDKFETLPAWPALTKCRVMRSINNFLVACDVTEDGTRFPELVRWSTRADPGSIPNSWDYTDATNRAGRVQLRTQGAIQDAIPLRDSLILYQQQYFWIMNEVGGPEVFEFRRGFELGALSRRCIVDWRGRHVVFSFDDIVVHDGNQAESIAEKRIQRDIFNNIDSTNYERSFVAINYAQNEIWFCYPAGGSAYSNEAWVWNWARDTWGKRELPNISHASHGIVDDTNSVDTFDGGEAGTFDSDDEIFNASNLAGAQLGLLFAGTNDTKLYEADSLDTFDGTDFTANVVRESLPLGPEGDFDNMYVKTVREIVPEIQGTEGGVVNVHVGTRDGVSDSTSWMGPYAYTIGTSRKLDVKASGRYIDVRFESTTDIEWSLTQYRVQYRVSGER